MNHNHQYKVPTNHDLFERDKERIEIVTVCVGFDDILDYTLTENHSQCDQLIVVTSHEDRRTQNICHKHGATCVPTDLFHRHNNIFSKGSGINRGFDFFKYYGWRLHIDSDIILPHNFRRLMFNHAHLDTRTLYGCDRINVVGVDELIKVKNSLDRTPQHSYGYKISPCHDGELGSRYVDGWDGYCPIGAFQMWHASHQKQYPCSRGDASHDDVSFAKLWPREHRQVLPFGFCYHLVPVSNQRVGNNWNGRKQPRLDK